MGQGLAMKPFEQPQSAVGQLKPGHSEATHKSTVLSLREIADGLTDKKVLEEADLPAVQAPKVELEALDPSFDL